MQTKHRLLAIGLGLSSSLQAQQAAPAPASNATVLPQVTVTAQDTAYGPPPTTSVTGLTAPQKELPITINTVTDQFIKDTSVQRLRDLVGYVPGINASEDTGGTGDLINIRGFDVATQSYVNGLRNRIGYYASRSFANIDHLDILKGPAGVEFGVGDPGGFVNYVTKKPQTTASYTLGADIGSYNFYSAHIDATGPLWTPAAPAAPAPTTGKDAKAVQPGATAAKPSDLGVFYHFIAQGESADSFRDTYHSDRVLIAPSILWNYDEGSSVLLEFEYSHRNQPFDRGIIYMEGAGFANNFAPIDRSYHEPTDFFDSQDTRTELVWTHKINDNVSLRFSGQVTTSDSVGNGARNPQAYLLYGLGNQWDGLTRDVPRTPSRYEGSGFSWLLKPELLLNFDIGEVKNTGLLGFNYENTTFTNATTDGIYEWPIDFKRPVYGTQPVRLPSIDPADPSSLPAGARDFRFREETEEYGVYYQHKIDIADRLHLLGGVRYDWYDDASAFVRNIRTTPFPALSGYSSETFSWRAGAVFDVTKQVCLFAGYSESFLPQDGLVTGGGHADALEGRSWEGGIKASFLSDRLHATLSFFQIERKNMLEPDHNDPTSVFSTPIGTVKVPGVEFELSGEITRDLSLMAGVALMDSEISETQDLTTLGNRFHNVPQCQAGIRLRYDTSRWLIPGLSVGLGAVYVGDRFGDDTNTFTLPEYWRFDAGLYYQVRNWNFKLTCENLCEQRYYLASQGFADTIAPGAPRTFMFGVEVKF